MIILKKAIKYKTGLVLLETIVCNLIPSFEIIEEALKNAGLQRYLDEAILYKKDEYEEEFTVKSVNVVQNYTQ